MQLPQADKNKVIFPKFEYIDHTKKYPAIYSLGDSGELAKHKIVQVKTLKLRNRFPRLTGKNAFRTDHGYGGECIAKVLTTHLGAEGWGLYPGNFWDLDPAQDQLVLGKTVAELFSPEQGVVTEAAEPFDFALHDLAGVILNLPVHRMLGSNGSNPVCCYDTMILMDDLSPDSALRGIAQILAACQQDYELGYRDFKLKIGRAPQWMSQKDGVRRDIEAVRLVREHFPDAKLMVDANDAYTPGTIKTFIDGVADCNLFWIEEAFREDREGLRSLRDYLDERSPQTPIADGESRADIGFLLELARERLLNVLQMDIAFLGFTAWRRILPLVGEAGAIASPHCWGFGLKTNYCCSLAAVNPLMNEIEGMVDETEGVDTNAYAMCKGKKAVPDLPGFGMPLVWGLELLVNRL